MNMTFSPLWLAHTAAITTTVVAFAARAQAPAGDSATDAPHGAAAQDSSAWDSAIKKSTQEQQALETDEERERRDERLSRDLKLNPTGRLGPRIDAGMWLLDVYANFQGMIGAQIVHPLGQSFELFGAPGVALGAGRYISYGFMVDAGIRLVIVDRYFVGAGGNLSFLNATRWGAADDSGSSSCVDCDSDGDVEGVEPYGHGLVTLGFYGNRRRQLEIGVDLRVGSGNPDGDFSFLPMAHATYLFPLW